jgi:hypothetical protein
MASYNYTFTSGDTVTPTKLNSARTVSEIVNADVSATAAIAGNFALSFGTNNTERMRIDASGNVGIGTASPTNIAGYSTLEINNSTNGGLLRLTNGTQTLWSYVNSGGGFVGTFSNHPLIVQVNNTERMRIDASGNVLIGTTTAAAPLTLSGSGTNFSLVNTSATANNRNWNLTTTATNLQIRAINDAGAAGGNTFDFVRSAEQVNEFSGSNSGNKWFVVDNLNARVFIGGTTAPSLSPKFGVHGYMVARTSPAADSPYVSHNAATSGDNVFIGLGTEASYTARGSIDYNRSAGVVRYNTTSDETLKNVIGDADPSRSLEILSQTKLKNFSWKDDPDNRVQMGVIAQELASVYAGAVSVGGETESGYRPWAVDKTAFTFHLIAGWQAHAKAIQELSAKVEALEAAQ